MMGNNKKIDKIVYLKNEMIDIELQLKNLHNHSFGFGTKYEDIDNFLRPIIKNFLESKLFKIQNEIENILNS